jgi:4-diphosphocytidyl-2C-methyl-D-erythritol kinase
VEAAFGVPERELLVAWPGESLSTGAVYAAYEPRRATLPASIAILASAQNGGFYNDLGGTALALCEPMRRVEAEIRRAGLAPLVAGSGSSVTTVVDGTDPVALELLREQLHAQGASTWVVATRG